MNVALDFVLPESNRWKAPEGHVSASTPEGSHRWPRATTADLCWGPLCECGNLKTDQALTCTDCAVERRRAADYWETRTCACGGPKMRRAAMCRPCRNELMRGVPTAGVPQAESHPWRQAETLRLLRRAA